MIPGTPSGDCELVRFELAGMPFMAIGAGPLFKFNPAVSFQLKCSTPEEVDALWEQLFPEGKVVVPLGTYPFSARYGWLEDRYGVSWQLMQEGGNATGQRIIPVLMFVGGVCGKTEEAIDFYVRVFNAAPDRGLSKTKAGETKAEVLARYGKGEEPDREGTVRYAEFRLHGQKFGAMDSARPHAFAFNEAISFLVPCETALWKTASPIIQVWWSSPAGSAASRHWADLAFLPNWWPTVSIAARALRKSPTTTPCQSRQCWTSRPIGTLISQL